MVQSSRPDDGRPDPDALLAAFRRESAGRMKVFVGAAPGVGKTYAMLQGARRLKEEGVDVVIGLVETHGRAETSALVEGLEVLPRRMVEYRGRTIAEFDLDAALARKPAADRRRRARAHQCSREPPSQALAGRSGAARSPASTSGPRSTSSISKAWPTSSRAFRASSSARPFPIASCRRRPTSCWSTSRRTSSSSACTKARSMCPRRRGARPRISSPPAI